MNNGAASSSARAASPSPRAPPARASGGDSGNRNGGDHDGGDDDYIDEDDDDHIDEDDGDYIDGDGDNDNWYNLAPPSAVAPPVGTPPAISALSATYNLQTNRWRLSTGRDVETILYQNCCLMDAPTFAKSLAPSFVIDLEDPVVSDWFNEEERCEIRQCIPPMPNDSGVLDMFTYLRRFEKCKTTTEVRSVLATSTIDQDYDPGRDFLYMWSELVIRNLYVSRYPSPPFCMRTE